MPVLPPSPRHRTGRPLRKTSWARAAGLNRTGGCEALHFILRSDAGSPKNEKGPRLGGNRGPRICKMSRLIDLTGQRFTRLIVVRRVGSDRSGQAKWECRCDCGGKTITLGGNLRKGNTHSCGCYHVDRTVEVKTRHGHARKGSVSSTHRIWWAMLERCENPKDTRYVDYGGRGITVCERWHIFENFFADMGERPSGRTLDRRDNDLGYSPENCRWATSAEQRKNQRSKAQIAADRANARRS